MRILLRSAIFVVVLILSSSLLSAFKVYWNFPSKACQKTNKINFKSYRIKTNKDVDFFGEKVVIFYEFTFALYPYYKDYKEDSPIHGGTPQNCSLEKHLKEVENNITRRIPNENFKGLGIIDLEEWRPLFDENGYGTKKVYQNISMEIVRKKSKKGTSEEVIKQKAIKEFNRAARKFLVKTIQKAKAMRKNAKWGFYGFPYCNYDAGKNEDDFECSKKYRDWNDEMMFIFNESTALFPSIYLGFDATSEQRFRYVHAILREAQRIAKKARNPPLPIYAYTKIEYNPLKDINGFYDDYDLYTTIKQPADLGIDGIIIWSSSANMADRCPHIQKVILEKIGPKIRKTVNGHKKCREEKCGGKKKCILSNEITYNDVMKHSYEVNPDSYKCE